MVQRQTNFGGWRYSVWGWMLALVVPGCESVLGLDKLHEGCIEGTVECAGNALRTCQASGDWNQGEDCGNSGRTCLDGACIGECKFDVDRRCNGNRPEICNEKGQYVKAEEDCATKCDNGACVRPSCLNLAKTCGALGQEDCCATEWVEGGTYHRSNDPKAEATVSNFRLDRFEVTLGRFRAFVEAYPGSIPAAGAGARPKIPNSGWNSQWVMPPDKISLQNKLTTCNSSTWSASGAFVLEQPINCVTWYEAFAFCVWDGGWLPTEAEWNIAAAREGTAEHGLRVFPWSPASEQNPKPDHSRASYNCLGDANPQCNVLDILKVGSKSPAGNGPWNHADLAGNLAEWTMDSLIEPYVTPCDDCAHLVEGDRRAVRGGSWVSPESGNDLKTAARTAALPEERHDTRGFRCAYEP